MGQQESLLKFLVAEKNKPCEISSRICDVYGDTYFSPNWLNMSLVLWAWVETHWLSGQEKVLSAAVSKGGHAVTIDLLELGATVNDTYYYQLFWQNLL